MVGLLGLGLPLELDDYEFGYLADVEKPVLVVQGEEDEFGSGEAVAERLAPMGAHVTLVRIPGADHYFSDRLDELRESIRGYYASGPGARLTVGA